MGEKNYIYEPGSVKSQYFSKIHNTDNDPLKGKTANLEKLVENKLRVNICMTKVTEIRNNAEMGSADYNNAELAMNKLKPIQKTARITTDLKKSNAALIEAQAIADG